MKTTKIKYDNRDIEVRVCECGEAAIIIKSCSMQSPCEQAVTIECPKCGRHNLRVGWCAGDESFMRLVNIVVEKWNSGEYYEKGHRCKDEKEYNRLFVVPLL